MQIRTEQLKSQLQKKAAPLYFIFGDVPLLMQECCDEIRKHFAEEYPERLVFHVDNHFSWQDLVIASQELSLFSSKQIIELRMGSSTFNDTAKKALIAYAESAPANKILLITADKLEYQQQKTAWYQTLLKVGIIIQLWPIERTALPAWIKNRLAQYQISTDPEGLELLAEQNEGNLLGLAQEIEKLHLLYGSRHISSEEIVSTTSHHTHFEIFDLSNAVLQGDGARICFILNELKHQGIEAILVLWLLAKEVRTLISLAKYLAQGMNIEQAFTKIYIRDKQKSLFRIALEKHTLKSLLQLIKQAHALDRMVKGVDKGNLWNELERYALAISHLTTATGVTSHA